MQQGLVDFDDLIAHIQQADETIKGNACECSVRKFERHIHHRCFRWTGKDRAHIQITREIKRLSRQCRDVGDIDIFRRQLHIDFTVEISRAGGGEHARADRHMQLADGRHAIGVIRVDFRRTERFAVNAAVFQFAVDAQARVRGCTVEFDMPRHLTG